MRDHSLWWLSAGSLTETPLYTYRHAEGWLCHYHHRHHSQGHGLPVNTTNQQAERIALTRAFFLAQGKTLHVYTNSKYAFHVLLSHSVLWKEIWGTSITNVSLVSNLIQASCLPQAIGIILCKAQQTIPP